MSVVLVDLGDASHDLTVSNAGWSETVEVLRTLGVLDADRAGRLREAWLGQRLTQDEARTAGAALVAGPLAVVEWSGNVYPPDGHWRDALGGKPQYDQETYWPSWLRAFAGFCLRCEGLVVC